MSMPFNEDWNLSDYNWNDDVLRMINPPEKFELHDATMRDGAHVVDFSDKERIQLSVALSDLGVNRIEIESRASTIKRQSKYPPEKHWETLKNIANMGLKSKIFTHRNLHEGRSGINEALRHDVSNIVIQEPVHRGWLESQGHTFEQRIEFIHNVVSYAKESGFYVDFFINHVGLSELGYLLKIVKAGADGGADSICITDSEGNCTPQTFKFLTKKVLEVSEGKLPVEVHPHNDYGLALANTIASYGVGASVTHCCVNSLGSRAGNTALEEICIALRVLYNVELGLNYDKLYDVCHLVEQMQQWPVGKNKPFTGYGINAAPHKLEYFGKQSRII
jgi:methanogen homocitrate synthase